jgi:serine O-acetyltransferase
MLITKDLKRFASEAEGLNFLNKTWRGFVDPGIWIVCVYRAQDFFYRNQIPILPWLFFLINRILFSAEILPGAKIGGGLRIQHGSGLVIGNQAIVGENATIYHGVTIGSRLSNIEDGWPIIGSKCLLSAGSTILGPIRIFDNVRVGANTLVLTDIPSGSTVIGNPGKILKK